MSALCHESSMTPVDGWRHEDGLWHCPERGEGVSLPCPAGRPDAVGGPYCEAHGGRSRAQLEAERDWNWLAPECVGDADAVQEAGCLQLQTTHAYVVLARGQDAGSWLAWLGLGSLLDGVPRADYTGCGRPRCRSCVDGKGCGRGRYRFAAREAALADATAAWRAKLSARIQEISSARGDTLSWGVPVTPLADPIVIELQPGENAWDVAQERERVGSAGHGELSGLRGTGEAF